MFFDSLWTVSNKPIKVVAHDRAERSASVMSPSTRKFWTFTPFTLSRLPLSPRQSPSSTPPSHLPRLSPSILKPNYAEGLEKATVELEKVELTTSRSRSSQDASQAPTHSLPQAFSDTSRQSAVPLHHPHPRRPFSEYSSSNAESYHFIEEIPIPTVDPGTPVSEQSDIRSASPASSLVPTLIVSRSPSPRPHSCVATAEALGIKVRDFAYEKHGAQLAPTVPDIDQLKARYCLYRSAKLTPPSDVIEVLRVLEVEWLADAASRFEALANRPKPKVVNIPIIPWKRDIEEGRSASEDAEPAVATSSGSGVDVDVEPAPMMVASNAQRNIPLEDEVR
ncbi:hypothetical protein K439DRAFT_1640288 [Ramaria rubella]|nr:hypothetical protein K439DRAFT_1640288 [Ramaria rubella]